MIPHELTLFPGWIALVAAIALVLAMWCVLVWSALEVFIPEVDTHPDR